MVMHTGQEIKAGSLHPSGCSCFECFKAQTAAKERAKKEGLHRRSLPAPPKKVRL